MKLRRTLYWSVACMLLLLASCGPDITPTFTYEPTDPKAGEPVVFTNSTSDGELWNWYFGDDTEIRIKTPTKIYTKAGKYDVTLMVDSNSNFVTTKQIIVYDSLPTIELNVEEVKHYEYFTVSALVYNPDKHDLKYKWEFSDNARGEDIVDNVSEEAEVELLFSVHNVVEPIKLTVTVGDSVYTAVRNVEVQDVKAQSLVMIPAEGKALRQRIYKNGLEPHSELSYTVPAGVNSLEIAGGMAYLFSAGTTSENPSIEVVSLSTLASETMISSTSTEGHSGFYNGHISGNMVYWTDLSNMVYRTNKTTRNATFEWGGSIDAQTAFPYYFVAVDRLPYGNDGLTYDQVSGGFAEYDGTYFWGKQGTGSGIYQFTEEDILDNKATGTENVQASILKEYAIKTFVIHEMDMKIYFVDADDKLYVCNLDGSNAKHIADDCLGGLAIDKETDCLFFNRANTVEYIRLYKGTSNNGTQEPKVFYEGAGIKLIKVDTVKR